MDNHVRVYTLRKQYHILHFMKPVQFQVDFFEVRDNGASTANDHVKCVEARCLSTDNITKLPFGIRYYLGDEEFELFETNIYRFYFKNSKFVNSQYIEELDFELDTQLYTRSNNFVYFLFPTKTESYMIRIKELQLYVNKNELARRSSVFKKIMNFNEDDRLKNKCTADSWTVDSFIPLSTSWTRETLHAALLLEFYNDQQYFVTRLNAGRVMRLANVLHLDVAYMKCIEYFKTTSESHFAFKDVVEISYCVGHNEIIDILRYCDFATLKSFTSHDDWKNLEIYTQMAILGAIIAGPQVF